MVELIEKQSAQCWSPCMAGRTRSLLSLSAPPGARPLTRQATSSGELELSSEDMMSHEMMAKELYRRVAIWISFDAQHKASVKNVVKTKTEVTEYYSYWVFRFGHAAVEGRDGAGNLFVLIGNNDVLNLTPNGLYRDTFAHRDQYPVDWPRQSRSNPCGATKGFWLEL